MEKMADSTISKPLNPEKRKSDPSNPEYVMEYSNYMMDSKSWFSAKENWEENGQRVYSLILQHSHPTLELKISEQTGRISVRDSRAMDQYETKHAAMSVVEYNLELMLCFQEKDQYVDDFMRICFGKT